MNETVKTIHNLGTVHGNFNSKEITDNDLNTILEASVRAANSSSRQAYSIVVIRNKETMKNLGYTGSVMLVYCIDFYRQRKLAEYLDFNQPVSNIREYTTGTVDASIAMQTAVIAAKSIGIESLITNCIHRGNINRVFESLNLPNRDCFPVIALVLGYANSKPEKHGRLVDSSIIHNEKYNKLDNNDCERLISIYDKDEMGIILKDDWKKLGFKNYLSWLFSKWFKYSPIDAKIINNNKDQFNEILKQKCFYI